VSRGRGHANDQAQVTFDLQDEQKIYKSTRLALRYQNLLGQRYLSLTAGAQRGARAVARTNEIGAGMTDPGFDLTALLNGFKPLFETIDPGEVNKFANNIIAVLQGQGPPSSRCSSRPPRRRSSSRSVTRSSPRCSRT
jgi:phospholipid/cholesterol/gamma-HCH transport system substrate-binding protein